MSEQDSLVLRDNIKGDLLKIKSVEDGLKHLNKIKTIEMWVKTAKKDAELQNIIAEQKLRTQRILGELLANVELNKGSAGQLNGRDTSGGVIMEPLEKEIPTLADYGLNKKQSSTFQQIASIPQDQFEEFIAEKKSAVNNAVAELTTTGMLRIAKEIKQENNFNNKKSAQTPKGIFNIIYCDPPWQYDFAETDSRKIENQYPTMAVDEICSMSLPEISNDALLLMWATAPKLLEALKVVNAWGFNYKTHGVWDKGKIGMGYWFRGQHELLLIATKGNFPPPLPEFRNSSIFKECRTNHSAKPIFYYEWIEKAFSGNKIELFARRKRNGWDSWGNEL